jgi:membrane protein DedA with SNARE-associated domain
VLNLLNDLSDWLLSLSGSPFFVFAAFVVALLDSIIPVVPSETMLIVGGVAAGAGEQKLGFVLAAGALGAFAGDNLAYQLGKSYESGIRRILFRGEKGAHRLEWAAKQLDKRGGLLLITARFIPGGRTAVTISSGVTRQPRRRFMIYDAIACVIWASYATLLGYIGGKTFEDNHTRAFLFAFGLAVGVTLLIEGVRWLHGRLTGKTQATDDAQRA